MTKFGSVAVYLFIAYGSSKNWIKHYKSRPIHWQSHHINHIMLGRGVVLGQPRSSSQGLQPQCFPVSGFTSVYVYILWFRTTKLDAVTTHMGKGLIFRG